MLQSSESSPCGGSPPSETTPARHCGTLSSGSPKRPASVRYQIETFTTTAVRNYLGSITARNRPAGSDDPKHSGFGCHFDRSVQCWLPKTAGWSSTHARSEVSVREHGRPAQVSQECGGRQPCPPDMPFAARAKGFLISTASQPLFGSASDRALDEVEVKWRGRTR
jgi:hypothetical protein